MKTSWSGWIFARASSSVRNSTRSTSQEAGSRTGPVTAAVVLTSRQGGLGPILDLVEERAPDGFTNLADVISQQELEAISDTFNRTTSADRERLNNRPSLSVR